MTTRSVFDHPLVTERYFFPRSDAPPRTTSVAVNGAVLACAAHCPHEGAPVVVHFHGNGEVVADYVPEIAEAFATAGLNTFFAEYRGYGGSTGTPSLVGMLEDVGPVLAATGVAPGRTFVYGRSIGSIYAIEAARRCPGIAGLVLESGIADPLERVLLRVTPEDLGVGLEAMQRDAAVHMDHRAKLGEYPGRVLVLHAANDRTVAPSHAERIASWARQSELVIFARGDHNSILALNLPAIVAAVRRFAFTTA